jgi:hypothetical protein
MPRQRVERALGDLIVLRRVVPGVAHLELFGGAVHSGYALGSLFCLIFLSITGYVSRKRDDPVIRGDANVRRIDVGTPGEFIDDVLF